MENDIRITDISVSREHAHIFRGKDKTVWVKDLDSKFGSSVQVQRPVRLENQYFQIGRTTIQVKIFKDYGLIDYCLCCFKKNKNAGNELRQTDAYPEEFELHNQ